MGLLRPRLLCSIQLGSAQSKLAVKGESPSWIQTLRIPQLQLHKGSSSERLDRHVGNAVPIPLPALRRTLTPPPVHPGRTQTLRVTSQVLRRKSQSLGFHPLLEGNTLAGSSGSSLCCSSPTALNEGDLLTPTSKQYRPGGDVAFENCASGVSARSRALQHKLAEGWVPSLSLDMIVGSITPEHHMSTRAKQLSDPLNPELWSSCSGVGRAATLPVAGHYTPAGVWQPPTLPGPALNMYHDAPDKILEMLRPFAETTAHWSQKARGCMPSF